GSHPSGRRARPPSGVGWRPWAVLSVYWSSLVTRRPLARGAGTRGLPGQRLGEVPGGPVRVFRPAAGAPPEPRHRPHQGPRQGAGGRPQDAAGRWRGRGAVGGRGVSRPRGRRGRAWVFTLVRVPRGRHLPGRRRGSGPRGQEPFKEGDAVVAVEARGSDL